MPWILRKIRSWKPPGPVKAWGVQATQGSPVWLQEAYLQRLVSCTLEGVALLLFLENSFGHFDVHLILSGSRFEESFLTQWCLWSKTSLRLTSHARTLNSVHLYPAKEIEKSSSFAYILGWQTLHQKKNRCSYGKCWWWNRKSQFFILLSSGTVLSFKVCRPIQPTCWGTEYGAGLSSLNLLPCLWSVSACCQSWFIFHCFNAFLLSHYVF